MQTQSLDGNGWTVQAVGDLSGVPEAVRGRTIPATVPGCVHLDLIRAGLLEHPNRGYAERDQEWVGRTDWRYELRFEAEPEVLAQPLVFVLMDRVDTVSQTEMNGQSLGRFSNSFTPSLGDARDAVVVGSNTLAVTISAPITAAEREHARLRKLPHNGDHLGWHPFQMLRKSACNFGWDWGPRVATSGIAGSVTLMGGERFGTSVPTPTVRRVEDGRWSIEWGTAIRGLPGTIEAATLRRSDDGTLVAIEFGQSGEDDLRVERIIVASPALWWPRGYGEQALYDLSVSFRNDDRLSAHRWRIGFRTVSIDTSADANGSSFTITVNDRPVFCRGANWIPDTLFPTEASPARIRGRVRQAADANMNMLRVWGGGQYEQTALYESCDELGVLVWQDFMFACALYPEGEREMSIGFEAVHQINRLASHPSVVLWCGGNECIEGYQHWGWKERLRPGERWGQATWEMVLPTHLNQTDPTRPYWPNSPWSGTVEDVRDPRHGDRHTWDLQFEGVREIVPRFVSEFGRVAPACERTLWEAGVLEEAADIDSWPRQAEAMAPEVVDALEHRLRQTGGSKVAYEPVLPEHFRNVAADLRGWLWQTQILQARAMTTHIEWLRANSPHCMGALIWQLNDCWACQSWALIDSGGRPKPAWYAVRRAFEPRLLTIQPMHGDERLSAVLLNDTDEPIESECLVRRVAFDGAELARATATIHAGQRSVGRVDALLDLVGQPEDRSSEVLVVECHGARSVWFWERDRELTLPDSPFRASLVERDGCVVVRLESTALSRDVIIAADLLGEHARAADNTFTMLAGEVREVEIEGAEYAAGLPIGEVVRCASGAAVAGPSL